MCSSTTRSAPSRSYPDGGERVRGGPGLSRGTKTTGRRGARPPWTYSVENEGAPAAWGRTPQESGTHGRGGLEATGGGRRRRVALLVRSPALGRALRRPGRGQGGGRRGVGAAGPVRLVRSRRSRGRGGFARALLGSVSQHVSQHASCPVQHHHTARRTAVRGRPVQGSSGAPVSAGGPGGSCETLQATGPRRSDRRRKTSRNRSSIVSTPTTRPASRTGRRRTPARRNVR